MFEELRARIGATANALLRTGYAGRQPEVLTLIADLRAALQAQYGTIAVWEREELMAAETFANNNWLLAAVTAVEKALVVSQLPDDEYWGGYCYTKPQVQRTPRAVRKL